MRRQVSRISAPGSRGWAAARRAAYIGLLFVLSCREIQKPGAPLTEPPKAILLKDGEVPLLMTRLGEYPRRIVTAAERVGVRFYFDPKLIDIRQVKGYGLWSQEGDSRVWKKIGAASPDSQPLAIDPGEGLHALRASVTCSDGVEKLVPAANDPPAVWLCIDRTPPVLSWVWPPPETSIAGRRTVDIAWYSQDLQHADAPVKLEWSPDRGTTWRSIAQPPAGEGRRDFRWTLPADIAGDILVRVTERDLAGHESEATLPLSYPSGASAPQLAQAHETPLRASRSADVGLAPTTSGARGTATATPPAPSASPTAAPAAPTAKSAGTPAGTPAVSSAAAAPDPAASAAFAPIGPQLPAPAPQPSRSTPDVATPASPAKTTSSETCSGSLTIGAAPSGVVAGGSQARVAWTAEGLPQTSTVVVEWGPRDGSEWEHAAEAPASQGGVEWTLPHRTAANCAVRLSVTVTGAAAGRVEAMSRDPFTVDADPPALQPVDVPEVAGARLEFRLASNDPGGSGLASVQAYLRKAEDASWRRLDDKFITRSGDRMQLDLAGSEEGAYDLWLRGVDRAGNASAEPYVDLVGPTAAASLPAESVRFRLDRTPPSLALRGSPGPWVAGFQAEALIDVDWTDGIPPLLLEGLEPDGTWRELGRWASVAPDQNRFAFLLPAGVEQYTVRFSVADGCGNKASQVLGPRPVEASIRLTSFTDSQPHSARGSEKVQWSLHPAAVEVEDELKVDVEHQPRRDGPWQAVYTGVPPRKECYWDLPGGDTEEHRLRVRLLRRGKAVGESVSSPFSIGGKDVEIPTVVKIQEESIFYSDQARTQTEKYDAAVTSSRGRSSSEVERISRAALGAYEKALSIDPKNYHAAYGLAQFLNALDGEKNAAQVRRWLERTLEIKPDHFWALNDLGAAYIRDGDYAKAEESLRKGLRIQASAVASYNLGLALFFEGKVGDSREHFETALQAGRGSVPEGEVYYYLVQSYLQQGNMARARDLFREKRDLIPEDMREDIQKALEG